MTVSSKPAPHNWVASTLGHGETMCSRCKITNREAAVLGMLNECDAPPIDKPAPLDLEQFKGHSDGPWAVNDKLSGLGIIARVESKHGHGVDNDGWVIGDFFGPAARANALLAAAAPALLARLKDAEEALEKIASLTAWVPTGDPAYDDGRATGYEGAAEIAREYLARSHLQPTGEKNG